MKKDNQNESVYRRFPFFLSKASFLMLGFLLLLAAKIPAQAGKSATFSHTHTTKCYKATSNKDVMERTCGLSEGVVGTVTMAADDSKWTCHPEVVQLYLDLKSGLELAKNPFHWNGGSGSSSSSIEVGAPCSVSCDIESVNAGTVSVSMTISHVDMIEPKLSAGVSTRNWTKDPVTISLSGSDDLSGLAVSPYTFDGGNTFGTSSTLTVTQNGSYLVGVRDKAGNEVYSEIVISNIDNKGPIIHDYIPSTTAWTNKTMSLTVKTEDEGIGLHTYAYSHDGGANYTANPSTNIYNNGSYSIIVRDRLGNSSTYGYTVTNIDKENPSISSLSGETSKWVKDGVDINVSATDGLSGIEGYSFDGGKTFGSSSSYKVTENKTVNVVVKDKAGNTASKSITIDNIDSESPEIQTLTRDKTGWTTEGVTLNVSASDTKSGLAADAYSFDGGKSYSGSSSYSVTENGTYTVCVKDKAGNVVSKSITVNNIDKKAPVIKFFGAADSSWTNSKVRLSVDASDDQSGLATLAFSFDGQAFDTGSSITVSSNGSHSVTVKDMAGNTSSATVTVSNIDKGAPTISAIKADNGSWTNNSVSVSVTAGDSESGIEGYSFDGGKTFGSSNSYTLSKNASLDIVVKDKAGNSASSSFQVSNIDKTSPEISDVSVSTSEWTNKDVTISVTATDRQSGLSKEAYSYNGGSYNASSSYVISKNGTYSVTVRDEAGNTAEKTISVNNIDKEAPVIIDITKSCEDWTEDGLSINVQAQDNSGGSGGLTYSFDGGSKYVATSSAYIKKNGSYSVCVKDRAGNISTQSVTVANIGKSPSQIEKERLEAQKEAERKAAEEKEAAEKLKEAQKKKQEQEEALRRAEEEARKAKEEAEAQKKEAEKKKADADAKKKAYEEAKKEAEAKKKAYEEAKSEQERKEKEAEYKKSVEEEQRLAEEYKKSLEEEERKAQEAKEAEEASKKSQAEYEAKKKNQKEAEEEYKVASESHKKAEDESKIASENANDLAKKVEKEQNSGIINGIKNALHNESNDITPYDSEGNLISVTGESSENAGNEKGLSDASLLQNSVSETKETGVKEKGPGILTIMFSTTRNRVISIGIFLLLTGILLGFTLNYIYMFDGKHVSAFTCVGVKYQKARIIINVKSGKINREGKYRIYFSLLGRLLKKNKPVYISVEGREDIITAENDRYFEYTC